MLFSEGKRSPLLWLHNTLKTHGHVPVRSKHHRFFLGNLQLSSEIFGPFRKMFGNDFLPFGQLLENVRNSSKSVRKSAENHPVFLYNKENNTWLLVDMEFLFSCST